MLIIGLTGGVASGKNFISDLFSKFKIPVFDADLEVHKLFSENKNIFSEIKKHFPDAIQNNQINRKALGSLVFQDKEKLNLLEKIIYPELHKSENKFLRNYHNKKSKMVILNIPLLFEKGGYKRCDKTIAIVAPKAIRKLRFAKRLREKDPNIDQKTINLRFEQIIKNQYSDSVKKSLADFVINNGLSPAFALKQVKTILKKLK